MHVKQRLLSARDPLKSEAPASASTPASRLGSRPPRGSGPTASPRGVTHLSGEAPADAGQAKEAVRELYRITDPDLADSWLDELAATLDDRAYTPEIRRLGRTLKRWRPQIAAWHRSRASDGPIEATNNLAKRIKRVAFGITNWTHWRVASCSTPAGRTGPGSPPPPPPRELPKCRQWPPARAVCYVARHCANLKALRNPPIGGQGTPPRRIQ
jgi:hypothetical protein